MPHPQREFYVIAAIQKFGDHQIFKVTSNSRIGAEKKLREEGFRVLYGFSNKTLKSWRMLSKEEFANSHTNWPTHIYDLIMEIND